MRTPAYQVVRNTFLLFGAHIIAKSFLVVSSIILANYLGVEIFGKYSFALAFTALFIPLCDLGTDLFLTRELARQTIPSSRDVFQVLMLKIPLSIINFLLTLGFIQLLHYPEETKQIVYLIAIATIVRTYITTSFAVFRAIQKIQYESLVTIIERGLEFAIVLIVAFFKLSLFEFLILVIVSSIFSGVYAFWLLQKKGVGWTKGFDYVSVKKFVRGGIPFALTSIFVTVYFQIDSVMLSKMVGDASVGIYRSAYNLIFGLFIISAALVTNLFPFVSKYYEENREMALRVVQQSVRYSLLIGIPIALGTTLFSRQIMSFLYKEEFLAGSTTLAVIIWVLPVMFTTSILGTILGAIRLQNMVLIISIINAIVNILLNLFLIPFYQQNGAAIATVVTEIVGLGLLSVSVVKAFGNFFEVSYFLKVCLASLFIIPVYLTREIINFPTILFLAVLLYGIGLLSLRTFSFRELKHVIGLID